MLDPKWKESDGDEVALWPALFTPPGPSPAPGRKCCGGPLRPRAELRPATMLRLPATRPAGHGQDTGRCGRAMADELGSLLRMAW
jgi:hypothetical protein